MNYQFEQINGDEEQIRGLYWLLQKRVHTISHEILPDYEFHADFVKNHPYLHWFIVKDNDEVCGSFYIKRDNSIGLNLLAVDTKVVLACINYIKENFRPEAAQASLIPEYFYINVAFSNKELIEVLKVLDKMPLQTSFRI